MFTGIIQATGIVRSIQSGSRATRLTLQAPDLPGTPGIGASVCVSGVCLTVAGGRSPSYEFDVIPETLARSTLGGLSVGDRVNMELSLRAGDPLDGHVVQGHVDGVARVRGIRRGDDGHVVTFEVNESLMPFIIPKGSIAIDGVSLTIAEVTEDAFSVALIPTTLSLTTLGPLKIGERVNVETDILARTIVTTMQRWSSARPGRPQRQGGGDVITVQALRENGW